MQYHATLGCRVIIIVWKFLMLYGLLEWINMDYQLNYELAITIQEQQS